MQSRRTLTGDLAKLKGEVDIAINKSRKLLNKISNEQLEAPDLCKVVDLSGETQILKVRQDGLEMVLAGKDALQQYIAKFTSASGTDGASSQISRPLRCDPPERTINTVAIPLAPSLV